MLSLARSLFPVLIASAVLTAPLSALDCRSSALPAATLLLPYFEVDLADPAGATTLISIGGAASESVLANVVLWTDCGFPALSFFVYLRRGGVQSLNLRSILVDGALPVTGPMDSYDTAFPGCSDPIEVPELDAEAVAALQARFGGEPDPHDGLCYGSHRPGSRLARGYLTVDVVNACSDSLFTPLDDGYFEPGGTGLASNDNVLRGDFFLVDPEGNAAQGEAAVSVVADAEYFEGNAEPSFYGGGTGDNDDQRYPLGSRYRTRHLSGGGFDGGTDLIVWFERSPPPPAPDLCHARAGLLRPPARFGWRLGRREFELGGAARMVSMTPRR